MNGLGVDESFLAGAAIRRCQDSSILCRLNLNPQPLALSPATRGSKRAGSSGAAQGPFAPNGAPGNNLLSQGGRLAVDGLNRCRPGRLGGRQLHIGAFKVVLC